MGEDASRIRFNPGVFARRRSFAYNILKAQIVSKIRVEQPWREP